MSGRQQLRRTGCGAGATLDGVTVVIPTRNEAGNVRTLLDRLAQALPDRPVEVLFVDDSDDDTPARALAVPPVPGRIVHVVHREPQDRAGGLGTAVVLGLSLAAHRWVVVMDADLQHPPALVPVLVQYGTAMGVDVVVGTRYDGDGDAAGLGTSSRRAVSTTATRFSRRVFGAELHGTTDPMSGFFAVRADALDPRTLSPRGFKVLLDLLVRHDHLRVTEVPFVFGRRNAEASKASLREGLRFLVHVHDLRHAQLRRRRLPAARWCALVQVLVCVALTCLESASTAGLLRARPVRARARSAGGDELRRAGPATPVEVVLDLPQQPPHSGARSSARASGPVVRGRR